MSDIQTKLFELQDLKYKEFQSKLMPTISPDVVIGVRTPALRSMAKKMKGTDQAAEFLKTLPHTYYEENNLHAFLIEQIKDYDICIHEWNRFLPYVDNWATCDSMHPDCFKKHLPELMKEIKTWITSEHTYTVRFAVDMLMGYYLDEEFDPSYLEMVAGIQSEEYYVNMVIAWYMATALAKQYNSTIPYIEEKRLSVWVHNKTIQKAIESYRITDEQKTYLRSLKRKG